MKTEIKMRQVVKRGREETETDGKEDRNKEGKGDRQAER